MKPSSEYLVSGVPAATAGAWGACSLALRFADEVFVFRGLSSSQRDVVLERFASLRVPVPDPMPSAAIEGSGAPSELPSIDFAPAPAGAFTPVPATCWEYDMALDFQAAQVDIAGPSFWARLTRASCHIAARTCLEDRFFIAAFENLFRILAVYRLAQRDVLVIHSAGVAQAGEGYILFGRSGAGKSTSCELLTARGDQGRGAHAILSDELNAVDLRTAAPDVMLQPMPFAGDFGHDTLSSEPVPLRRIYALVQAPEARVAACAPAEALARVVAACPFMNVDPFESDSVFERAERLLAAVALRKLYFPKDPSFWSAVEADVESHAAA